MNHQQGFVVGVSSGGLPAEASSDHGFVGDHGDLVMELVAILNAAIRYSIGLSLDARSQIFESQSGVPAFHPHERFFHPHTLGLALYFLGRLRSSKS